METVERHICYLVLYLLRIKLRAVQCCMYVECVLAASLCGRLALRAVSTRYTRSRNNKRAQSGQRSTVLCANRRTVTAQSSMLEEDKPDAACMHVLCTQGRRATRIVVICLRVGSEDKSLRASPAVAAFGEACHRRFTAACKWIHVSVMPGRF